MTNLGSDQPTSFSPRIRSQPAITPARIAEIVFVNRKIFYFFMAVMVLGCIAKRLFYIPSYVAQSTITIQQPPRNPMMDSPLADNESAMADLARKYAKFLRSSGFYLSVAESLKFKDHYNDLNLMNPSELSFTKQKYWRHLFGVSSETEKRKKEEGGMLDSLLIPVERLGGMIQDLTQVESDGGSTLTVSVTSLDPQTSMMVANTIADVFTKVTAERDHGESTEVRKFIENQLKNTTEELKRAELELVNFKKKNTVFAIDAEHKIYSERMSKLEADLESARLQFEQNQQLMNHYQERLQSFESNVMRGGSKAISDPDSGIEQNRKKLDSLKRQKELQLSQGINESSWQMQQINSAINLAATNLRNALADRQHDERTDSSLDPTAAREKIEELKKTNKSIEGQIASLNIAKAGLVKSLSSLPQEEQNLLNLTRRASLQFDLYSTLSKRLQEIEIQKISANSKVSIDELSALPGPVPRPNFLISLIFSLFSGIFFGTIGAVFAELLDTTVKRKSDLEEQELIFLGEIPRISEPTGILKPETLVCKQKPQSEEAMAFKFIQIQLKHYLTSNNQPAQVILVTSPTQKEGKSIVAANLALCSSHSGPRKRTVLIDCDFRNSAQAWVFGFPYGEGLTSVLSIKALLEDVIIRDKFPDLDIIPAGWKDSNPTELISDEKFSLMLEYLRTEYDTIIIDAPPVLGSVDASLLASLSDVIILTVSNRISTIDSVLKAHQTIYQICHKRVHAVLNNVRADIDFGRLFLDWRLPLSNTRGKTFYRASSKEIATFEKQLTRKKVG